MRRRAGWPACLLLAATFVAGTAQADVCNPDSFGSPIPDCQPQVQDPVHYDGWATSGWAYYCKGDHPYFYGLQRGQVAAYEKDNDCFSVLENVFADDWNKLDVTITNWCLKGEDITITMACSGEPPVKFANCGSLGERVGDPGCPQSNQQNHCSAGLPPFCAQTYNEICSDGGKWSCTETFGIAWCMQCE